MKKIQKTGEISLIKVKKKDDLADSFLMILYYLKKNKLINLI